MDFNPTSSLVIHTSGEGMDWLHSIRNQLKEQAEAQAKLADLYNTCSSLSSKLSLEVQKRRRLEQENRILAANSQYRQPNSNETSRSKDENNSIAYYQRKISDLENQVNLLKEERSELYKNQGSNAQRLLDLTDRVKTDESLLKEKDEELSSLRVNIRKLASESTYNLEIITEKNRSIQLLQDELTTTSLELTKSEEKRKELESENRSLLRRWLEKMNQEAETVNLSNMLNSAFASETTDSSIKPSVQNFQTQSAKVWQLGNSFVPIATSPNPTPTTTDSKDLQPLIIPDKVKLELRPHSDEINCIASSNQGTMFATASTDKKIMLFNSTTGHAVQTLGGFSQSVVGLQFSNDDKLLLGTSNDNSIRLFNLKTLRLKEALTGHIGKVYSAKFDASTTKLVSGSHDRMLKLWDLHRSICTKTLFTFSSCNDVAPIDPDCNGVVSGHLDSAVRFWDLRSGNCIKELNNHHTAQITSVTVNYNSTQVLTNSRDNSLKLFDLRTYKPIHTFQAEGYQVSTNWFKAGFSPDNRYATSGSVDGGIYHWDTLTGQLQVCHTQHRYPISAVAWSATGQQLYSVDKERNFNIWTSLEVFH